MPFSGPLNDLHTEEEAPLPANYPGMGVKREPERHCRSPDLFPIGLANGHAGYLPTADAMEQGGYETWRARTSYMEKAAASEVTAAMLRYLA